MFNYKVYVTLNEGEQALVDWQYVNTGCFSNKLMDLIGKADGTNKARLALAYPLHVEAYHDYATVNGWWTDLQKRLLQTPLYDVNS